jgi:rRNA maturation protein Rpf1
VVKKLRAHFRAKEDIYEKQRITAHLELEKRVTERISSLKKKMSEDLRQYGEEDISIVQVFSQNATEITLRSSISLQSPPLRFLTL